jgi:glycosyltransferase involved in cell wall biosynthesis
MSFESKDLHFVQVLACSHDALVHDSRILRTADVLIDQGLSNSILILGDQESPEYRMIGEKIVKVARIEPRFPLLNAGNPYLYDEISKSGKMLKNPMVKVTIKCYRKYAYFKSMLTMILRDQPDVIWSNDYDTLKVSVVAKLLAPFKPLLVYDSHEFWSGSRYFLGKRGALRRLFISKLEKYLIQTNVDFVVSVNKEILDLISYGKPSYIIHNIPHHSVGDYNQNYFHNKYSLPADSKILLYLGGFSTGRGIEFLLCCSKQFDPNIKIVFMGYGSLKSYMTSYIQQNALGDRCFVHPAVLPDEVMKYIPAADIGLCLIEPICTSYYYALPNKFWEYVIGGIPMIASDLPSMSSLIHKYSLGTAVKSFDLKAFCGALDKLLSDYDSYKSNVISYSQGLLTKSREQYGILLKDIAHACEETYEESRITPRRVKMARV